MPNKLMICLIVLVGFLGSQAGCRTAAEHHQSLPSTKDREMTVGIVQKEIRVGMSGEDVAAALGSPNIVTKDGEGKEVWVFDKIATEVAYSYDREALAEEQPAGWLGP